MELIILELMGVIFTYNYRNAFAGISALCYNPRSELVFAGSSAGFVSCFDFRYANIQSFLFILLNCHMTFRLQIMSAREEF